MPFHQRRLPHFHEINHPIFLTWRLHDSLPPNRTFPSATLTSGQAFAAMDRLLDEARSGAFHLSQPSIANMIVEALHYNATVLGHYALHAFVVMPNHIHLLITPAVPLPKLTKSLKGITARRANAILELTGNPFWQDESYDHLVRKGQEFEEIRNYIEQNPVKAGFVNEATEFPWSSASQPAPPDEFYKMLPGASRSASNAPNNCACGLNCGGESTHGNDPGRS